MQKGDIRCAILLKYTVSKKNMCHILSHVCFLCYFGTWRLGKICIVSMDRLVWLKKTYLVCSAIVNDNYAFQYYTILFYVKYNTTLCHFNIFVFSGNVLGLPDSVNKSDWLKKKKKEIPDDNLSNCIVLVTNSTILLYHHWSSNTVKHQIFSYIKFSLS